MLFLCNCLIFCLRSKPDDYGLLFIDGSSALTWTLAWIYWTEKHLDGVSLLASELHFILPLKDALRLTFKSKGDNQRCMQQFWIARGQGGMGGTGPCLASIQGK